MNILKANNGAGVVYLGNEEPFNLLELVMEFTAVEGKEVLISDGAFITPHSREFFKFLEDQKGFKRIAIDSITTITMRSAI
jgi:hypothetical protein